MRFFKRKRDRKENPPSKWPKAALIRSAINRMQAQQDEYQPCHDPQAPSSKPQPPTWLSFFLTETFFFFLW
jgi:hypothetical protein